jgi:hypothetical protein
VLFLLPAALLLLLLLNLGERPSSASSLNTSRNLMCTSLGLGATM